MKFEIEMISVSNYYIDFDHITIVANRYVNAKYKLSAQRLYSYIRLSKWNQIEKRAIFKFEIGFS